MIIFRRIQFIKINVVLIRISTNTLVPTEIISTFIMNKFGLRIKNSANKSKFYSFDDPGTFLFMFIGRVHKLLLLINIPYICELQW